MSNDQGERNLASVEKLPKSRVLGSRREALRPCRQPDAQRCFIISDHETVPSSLVVAPSDCARAACRDVPIGQCAPGRCLGGPRFGLPSYQSSSFAGSSETALAFAAAVVGRLYRVASERWIGSVYSCASLFRASTRRQHGCALRSEAQKWSNS
jgi:hypothetical protein